MIDTPRHFDVDALRKTAASLPDEEKKRRQHHVWQHYLKSWAVSGQIYCLREGRIFPTGTTAVAVERDFYKLHKLNASDISLIKWLVIDAANPLVKRYHEDFLALLTAPALFEDMSQEIDAMIDTYRTNVLENWHAGIEGSFLPLLNRMLQQDASFYSTEKERTHFLHFISTQLMRTKGIKVRCIELVKQKNGLDLSRIWDIISCMFSVNLGARLFLEGEKRKLVLIENTTDVTFVTSDQPVINLHGQPGQPATKFSLYYPLAPHLALILGDVDEEPLFSNNRLTLTHVMALNSKIVEASHSQVFGDSEASITRFSEE